DNVREGEILADFLTLPDDYDDITVKLKEFTFKRDFLKYLKRNSNFEDYDFIHLSGHGVVEDKETAFFELPQGKVQPYEFPDDCFSNINVAVSACELGKVSFVDKFIEQTSPLSVLGPQREVPFRHACMFWMNYYSLVLHDEVTPQIAYDKTVDFLQGRISGAFKFHETELLSE
ncbi:MAG: hypothetical protein WCI92_20420, partial [Bacteroidota bacterium]